VCLCCICVVCVCTTDKNALNRSKQTALHLAMLAGCVLAVCLLVEHGAQILFTTAEAKSTKVSHFAVCCQSHSLTTHTPADVHIVFVSGQVPASVLHQVVSNHSETMVPLFVKLGLDINLTDTASHIPLHFAAHTMPKDTAFIDFLLTQSQHQGHQQGGPRCAPLCHHHTHHLITWTM